MTSVVKMLASGFAVTVGAALLAGMMLTNPSYDRALRPFVTDAAPQTKGATRSFRATFTGWETAQTITFAPFGRSTIRSTGGIFLITAVTVEGVHNSTRLSAVWAGASGRLYHETPRIRDLAQQLPEQWAQPGLESRAIAIFELPPDEVQGGALLLSLPLDPRLDGKLRLAPPADPPKQQSERIFP